MTATATEFPTGERAGERAAFLMAKLVTLQTEVTELERELTLILRPLGFRMWRRKHGALLGSLREVFDANEELTSHEAAERAGALPDRRESAYAAIHHMLRRKELVKGERKGTYRKSRKVRKM